MDKQTFAKKYDQLTRKQKVYLGYFLQGLSDAEIIDQPDTGSERAIVSFHLTNIARTFDIDDSYRERLACLFYRFDSRRVSDKIVEKYGCKSSSESLEAALEYPDGFVPIGSTFYIVPTILKQSERSDKENEIWKYCAKKLSAGSTLLRIKAPRKFGKTSLVERLLRWGEKQGYDVVRFDFQEMDESRLSNLKALLQAICGKVCREMHIEPQFDMYWDEQQDLIAAYKNYFEAYLLKDLQKPLVLGLDNVDRLFQYPQVYDFFRLLRVCHEESKRSPIWKKLRCIVTYATGLYIKLDMNQSPFNVGEDIVLPAFGAGQVQELARRHGLRDFEPRGAVERLMAMVGGQPYLIRLALYRLAQDRLPLETLLEAATMPQGIYQSYLQSLWHQLNQEEQTLKDEIVKALKHLVGSGDPVRLSDEARCKLEGMGIIASAASTKAEVRWSCELYRQYFQRRFESES
jgi:hypothetical protein